MENYGENLPYSSKNMCGIQNNFVDYKYIKPPMDLDELVAELHKIFEEDEVNIEYVRTVMSLYKSNAQDWRKYAKFDPHRYTRNLVDSGNGKFNLIALCWGEGHGSSIHSHSDSHCFAKVLQGHVKEVQFEWPEDSEENEMKMKGNFVHKENEVMYINDSMGLHRVENASTSDRAVTLHLYAPPFDLCDCFDQRTGHKSVSRVTFWSRFGERTPFSKWYKVEDSMGGVNLNTTELTEETKQRVEDLNDCSISHQPKTVDEKTQTD